MTGDWLVLVESNTTGSGRLFCACARRLGLRPVLIAHDPGRYSYVAADQIDHRVTDTADPDAVLRACAALDAPVAGVTSSSEYFIGTAARVAAALGLPHADPSAIGACRDKHQQRIRLLEAGLPGPAFAAASTPDQAAAAASRIGLPVVVKPGAGTGSIGVRRCADAVEVRAAASYILVTDPAALALPRQTEVVVEGYLTGAEYSAEVIDGQVVGITEKLLGPEPYFVEVGHNYPAPLSGPAAARIGDAALAGLEALGLLFGGAHVELRHGPAGPVIVEVNPRLAGGMIPRAIEAATGVDMIFHVVAAAAGRPVPVSPDRAGAAAIRFLVAREAGTLAGVAGLAAARAEPGVVEVGVTAEIGQQITPRHSFKDRLAYVIAVAEDNGCAARAADAGLAALTARLTPLPVAAEGVPAR